MTLMPNKLLHVPQLSLEFNPDFSVWIDIFRIIFTLPGRRFPHIVINCTTAATQQN